MYIVTHTRENILFHYPLAIVNDLIRWEILEAANSSRACRMNVSHVVTLW
jgi:hypothetical protein